MTNEQRLRKNLKERLKYARSRHYKIPKDIAERIQYGNEGELRYLTENWQKEVGYYNFIDDDGVLQKLNEEDYQDMMSQSPRVDDETIISGYPNGAYIAGVNIIREIRNKLSIDTTDRQPKTKYLFNEKQRARDVISALVDKIIEDEGFEQIGIRLQPQAEEIYSALIGLNFASSQDEIDQAQTEALQLLSGRLLTTTELLALEEIALYD